jgi:Ca2+-binding EF-hand superfamily protein
MKFDKTFHNLEEPSTRHLVTKMTLTQLEEAIRDKVTENCKPNMNLLQALSRSFGDNRDRDAKFKVTLPQMKFTIWKKLMIYASELLIETLFKKYDPNNTGYVDLHNFADGVMKKTINYRPIVEEKTNKFAMKMKTGDAQLRFGQVYSPIIVSFLEHMRVKFKEYVNNNCRSPVYLVNSTNRMNHVQAKKFLEDQFKVVVGENVMKELIHEYDDNGLLNMKRLLKDCMVVDMEGKLGPDVNLITSSAITVDEMPLSVRSNRQSFESIQMRFREKVQERLKNDQPLSYLHLMFRSKENDKDPRLISKLGLRKVLYKQDITLSDADYDDYFRHFDRGDGKVVIRDFLLELLPVANRGDDNTYLPKKDVNFKAQDMLSKSLALLTGKKRDVGAMNGDELNRFRGSIVKQVENTIASSKHLDTTNDIAMSEFFRSMNSSSDFNQKRAESPRTADSIRAESPSRSKVDTPAGATAKSHDPKYSIITHQKKDYIKDDNNNNSNNSNNNNNNNNNNNSNYHNNNNYSEENDLTRSILDKKVSNQEESPEEIAFQIGRAAAIAAAQSKDNKDIASQIGIAAATYALNLLMNENKESFNQTAATKEAQNVSRPSSAQQRQSIKMRPQSAPVKNDLFMNASLRMNELEDEYTAVRGANPPSKWQLSQGSLHQDSVGSINSANNFTQMKTFDMGISMQSPSRPPSSRPSSSRPSSARPPSATRPTRPSSATNQREQSMSPAPPFRPSPSKPSPSTTSSPKGSPRSPREKNFTYTGIRRSEEMNPHHQALAAKYKFVNNNIKQSSNDYGSYFKTLQNEKKKNEKMMQKYREYLQKQKELEEEGKSGIHVNPSHSQRSFSAKPPPGRYSHSSFQSQTPRGRSASPSLNQKLANYGLEHDKWQKYSSVKPTIKRGGEADTFAAYAVMTPGKVTQINKKFALSWHKNAKKK